MDINEVPPDERERFIDYYASYSRDLILSMEAHGVLFDAITRWSQLMLMKYQAAFINHIQSEDLLDDLSADIDELEEGETQ